MKDLSAQSIALSIGASALVTVACRRMRIPALLPLLVVGLALGTSGLGAVDGSSLGEVLTGFIKVTIGLLVFEGALHLNSEELRRAPRAVWGMLTVGTAVTWILAAAAAHVVLEMPIPIAVLFGAALIVTGPTAVQPILRLVRVTPRLHSALAAEAVLIDPIGVVATVTTLEVLRLYFVAGLDASLASHGLWMFAKPLLGGAGVGVFMGSVGFWTLRAIGRSGRPEPQFLNLVAVGMCMTCVGLGEAITPEAGLAAVTICGMLMARARVLGATELRAFKELLAVILVGTLFILLASRFDVARLGSLTWRDATFPLVLLFVIRPIAVVLSTWRSKLDVRERIFAGTFAPRGIVALSVATVAATELTQLFSDPGTSTPGASMPQMLRAAQRLDLLTFVVIAVTVLFASTLSPLLAWALRVRATEGTTVLLIGAHPLSVSLARMLATQGIQSRIIDSNEIRVATALAAGLDAVEGDATDARWMDDVGAPPETGCVIAWTGNHDVDQLAARWADERIGRGRTGVWSSRPARGVLEAADIGAGQSITEWVDRLEDGRMTLVARRELRSLDRVLGWVRDGRFRLSLRDAVVPEAQDKLLFVGLAAPRADVEVVPAIAGATNSTMRS